MTLFNMLQEQTYISLEIGNYMRWKCWFKNQVKTLKSSPSLYSKMYWEMVSNRLSRYVTFRCKWLHTAKIKLLTTWHKANKIDRKIASGLRICTQSQVVLPGLVPLLHILAEIRWQHKAVWLANYGKNCTFLYKTKN